MSTSKFVGWLNSIFSKPHLLGWIFNTLVVGAVGVMLFLSYQNERHNNTMVLARTHEVAAQIFAPPRSAYRSRTQQTSELSTRLISLAWPLVIKGSDGARIEALSGNGPVADEYARLDAVWNELRVQLEAGIPASEAVQLIDSTARDWVEGNIFYQGRELLFLIWLALVVVYAAFVFFYVMPRSRSIEKTESLLLLVDAGLYFTVISWFTKTEIPDLGWIILAPVVIVFFEVFKNMLDNHRDRSVYIAGLLFLFFLFFGILQLRVEYSGAHYVVGSAVSALEDFAAYVSVGALIAVGLTTFFHLSGRKKEDD